MQLKNRILDHAPLIAGLYEQLEGDVLFSFVSDFFLNNLFPVNYKGAPYEFMRCDDPKISVRAHLKKCGYSLSMEPEHHLLVRLSAYAQKIISLYDSYMNAFENGETVAGDIQGCVRSFVESFIQYKEGHEGRSGWDTMGAFNMRFRYSMAMSPSDFAEIGLVVSTRNKYAHSGNSVRKIADNIKTYLRFFFQWLTMS